MICLIRYKQFTNTRHLRHRTVYATIGGLHLEFHNSRNFHLRILRLSAEDNGNVLRRWFCRIYVSEWKLAGAGEDHLLCSQIQPLMSWREYFAVESQVIYCSYNPYHCGWSQTPWLTQLIWDLGLWFWLGEFILQVIPGPIHSRPAYFAV